jgi:hypothetical protein
MFIAAGAAIGLLLVFAPTAKADFGIPCGKAGGCVDPPSSNGPEPDWVWEQPQQLFVAYLGNAQQAMRDGNWDAAEGWARRALQEQPGNAEAEAIFRQIDTARRRRAATGANEAGVQLANAGDYAGAVARFREALTFDPFDTTINKNLEYANKRLALANLRDTAQIAAATEKLNHEAAVAAAQREADGKSGRGLESLAGKIAGLAWPGCESLACRQAALGQAAGGEAQSAITAAGASDIARMPFDDRGGSITVIPPGASAPVTLPARPVTGEAAAIRERIKALYDEEAGLERKIKNEADSVKRAALIQKQSFVRSQKQVETIKLATFTARFAPDSKAAGK